MTPSLAAAAMVLAADPVVADQVRLRSGGELLLCQAAASAGGRM